MRGAAGGGAGAPRGRRLSAQPVRPAGQRDRAEGQLNTTPPWAPKKKVPFGSLVRQVRLGDTDPVSQNSNAPEQNRNAKSEVLTKVNSEKTMEV